MSLCGKGDEFAKELGERQTALFPKLWMHADLGKTGARVELVEIALRQLLRESASIQDLPPLPTFDGGVARVNVANRDALYEIMERD